MATLSMIAEIADELKDFYRSHSTAYYDPICYYHRYPTPISGGDNQRLRQRRQRKKSEILETIGKDGFQVSMDVQHFKPSELMVKVIDECIVVEGKHEEREDEHGFISRHFVRGYKLPKGYDANKVISTLSSDGVLTVSVPKPQNGDKSNERVIQIQQVGPAYLNVKENTTEIEVDQEKEKERQKEKEKEKQRDSEKKSKL